MSSAQARVKAKTSAPPQGQGEGQHDDSAGSVDAHSRGRSPDGAEAAARNDGLGSGSGSRGARVGGNINTDDPLVNEVVAKSKTLSEDTRHMLQELQLGETKETEYVGS